MRTVRCARPRHGTGLSQGRRGARPGAASLDFGTGDFSIEFWAYRSGSGQRDYPVLVKGAWVSGSEPGWAISFVGSSPDKLALHLNNKDVGSEQSGTRVLRCLASHAVPCRSRIL